jgi:NADH:ubiquinone oxidoreductase subunit E
MAPRKENERMNEVAVASACGCEQASEAELMERLDGVLAEYRDRPGALIPVLQIAQGIFGFLPEKVLKRIALAMGKSYSEVAGVVGFYAFFSTHPRGKHVIRVCLGTACYVRGGKQVLEAMKKELGLDVGGTTEDGMFSLEVARCFGACGLAPAMCIDEEVYKRVRPARIREILAKYDAAAARAGGNGGGMRKPKRAAPRETVKAGTARPRPKPRAARRPAAKKGVKVHG